MPRPRLLPSQRRRAAEACNFCREAKKKCSGTAPCTHCLRRGIAGQCAISLRPRDFRHGGPGLGPAPGPAAPTPGATPGRPPPSRQERLDQQSTASPLTTRSGDRPAPSDEHDDGFRPPTPSDSRHGAAIPTSPGGRRAHRRSDASSISAANPHARMLLNLRGERGKHPLAVPNRHFKSSCSRGLHHGCSATNFDCCPSLALADRKHQCTLAARRPCPFCSWFAASWPTRSARRSSPTMRSATRCWRRSLLAPAGTFHLQTSSASTWARSSHTRNAIARWYVSLHAEACEPRLTAYARPKASSTCLLPPRLRVPS